MKIKYVTPAELWSNYPELSKESKIVLTENQYRKQLTYKHSYTPTERGV